VTGSRTDHTRSDITWLGTRLQHLQTLSATLAGALTEQQAIEATLNPGLDVFEADQAVIAMLDESGTLFRIVAVSGYPDQVEADWSMFPNSDEFPLSDAVRTQQPVVVYGPEELIRRYPKLEGTGRSAALVCLPMGDFGGIALGYDREMAFGDAELEFMTAVVRQCSEAIRRTSFDAERGRRAERLALLAEAGAAFARSLDYRTTLGEVANLAVPAMADCCIVDVLEPTGLHQLATVHVEPGKIARVAELETSYPADPAEPHSAVGAVLRSGEALLVSPVTEEFVRSVTRDETHRDAVHALGMRSLIIVPLVARGRTLGAITLIYDTSSRNYDEHDLATAASLADRAALAIDNARLHQAQTEIARALQRGLLPDALPAIPGVEVTARYLAAGEGLEVGGDFYDVWSMDGSFGVAIGDVSGKGARAAAMTALARHTVRVAALHEPTPSRVLRVLNSEILKHRPPDMFCTAAYAYAVPSDDGGIDVTMALGGHPPGVIVRHGGGLEQAGDLGTLLGVREHVTLTDASFHLAPDDVLVLCTDGVIERREGRRMLGEEGLAEVLAGIGSGATAESIALAVERAVMEFASGAPEDDVAIVVVRPTGDGAGLC
jgi:serine phosphatase RsbU (regulator of sigma subunit)